MTPLYLSVSLYVYMHIEDEAISNSQAKDLTAVSQKTQYICKLLTDVRLL